MLRVNCMYAMYICRYVYSHSDLTNRMLPNFNHKHFQIAIWTSTHSKTGSEKCLVTNNSVLLANSKPSFHCPLTRQFKALPEMDLISGSGMSFVRSVVWPQTRQVLLGFKGSAGIPDFRLMVSPQWMHLIPLNLFILKVRKKYLIK